jgi:ribonuclease-3
LKDFLENIYSGLISFSPLKKYLSIKTKKSGIFPLVGFLTLEMKTRLEESFSIEIVQPAYYEQALTHRSFLQVMNDEEMISNERLEFLGDSVLGMIIAEYLFTIHSDIHEGELTKMRARLVNKKILAAVAKHFGLDQFIQLSFGAAKSLEHGSESILADAMEAFIAAVYIDSGIDSVRNFIIDVLLPVMMEQEKSEDINYKSLLLEIVQAKGYEFPKYSVKSEDGPDHDKEFTVEVEVNGRAFGLGKGKSKKLAEQDAAKKALEIAGELAQINTEKSPNY